MGLSCLKFTSYIRALYRDSAQCLEEDLSRVSGDRDLHHLLSSDLLRRDEEIFGALNPDEEHAVVMVTVPYALSAADKLQRLGYRTRIYLESNVLHSIELPTQRRDTLLLWVLRQDSLRESYVKGEQCHRHALVIAFLGDAPSHPQGALLSPEKLAYNGVSSISVTVPTGLSIEPFNDYLTEYTAKGIKV